MALGVEQNQEMGTLGNLWAAKQANASVNTWRDQTCAASCMRVLNITSRVVRQGNVAKNAASTRRYLTSSEYEHLSWRVVIGMTDVYITDSDTRGVHVKCALFNPRRLTSRGECKKYTSVKLLHQTYYRKFPSVWTCTANIYICTAVFPQLKAQHILS